MYQYANELAKRGHSVIVYHAIRKFEKKSSVPDFLRLIIYRIRGVNRPNWFSFNDSVRLKTIAEINDQTIEDGDIIFSTWWGVAYLVDQLSLSKGKKFNLIQGYEIWKGNKVLVHNSYSLKLHHLVIAKYLAELVENFSGKKPLYLPNAIDLKKFNLTIPPEDRNAASLCMLYSNDTIKGTAFGLEAIKLLKNEIPALRVELFSIYKNPGNLPEWITYNYRPHDLSKIYNRNAIFLSPSLTEGWALPPAEAMACGCAVVCTDIGGHRDYAKDGQTALLVNPEDSSDTKNKLLALIINDRQRIQIAKNANAYLRENFTWERSVSMLEEYFEKC